MIGLKVHRNRGSKTIHLSQGPYIRKVLARFGMNSANPTHTPLSTNENLTKTEDVPTLCNDEPYAELVGSLMYAAVGSRPDLTHTASALSQFTTRYERRHWMAAKRTLRYLVGTIDLGINYESNDASLTGYSDTDFANNELDRRSLTGYVFKIGNAAVTWNTRKQPTVALSTMEAEYMAVAAATREAIWLRQLVSELGIDTVGPTPIHVDNRAAIELTKDSKFHARAKHN